MVGSVIENSRQPLAGPPRPEDIPLPPATSAEKLELEELPNSSRQSISVAEQDVPVNPKTEGVPPIREDEEQQKVDAKPGVDAFDEKNVSRKKSFSVFGTLRKLSTTNLKNEKNEKKQLTPRTTTKPNFPSPVTPVEHVEVKKNSPPPTPAESKKSSASMFKSIRAAIRFSSKSAPNSPTVSSMKSATSPYSPVSPFSSRSSQRDFKKPTRTSTRLSEISISKPLNQRHSVRQVYQMPAPLRTASTWSPASTNPVLVSNPDAKLYTVWPKYPIIDSQIAEVQELLEGLLPNDKKAIETSREPGSQFVIHYWKAPLTAQQAEVVQANKLVSSIQLSKLDCDMSDMF